MLLCTFVDCIRQKINLNTYWAPRNMHKRTNVVPPCLEVYRELKKTQVNNQILVCLTHMSWKSLRLSIGNMHRYDQEQKLCVHLQYQAFVSVNGKMGHPVQKVANQSVTKSLWFCWQPTIWTRHQLKSVSLGL